MNRPSLKCSNCGGSDFSVKVHRMIPNGIDIVCCSCGRSTPIAYFDRIGKTYPINTKTDKELYDRTYTHTLTPKEIENRRKEEQENEPIQT